MRGRHSCSHTAKETKDSTVLTEGTHTFSSISLNPYVRRPDQFVGGGGGGGGKIAVNTFTFYK